MFSIKKKIVSLISFCIFWVSLDEIGKLSLRVHLDRTYFAETENWKYCSKIIFKYVNSTVRPIFNEKVVEKWSLWVSWIVYGSTVVLKSQKFWLLFMHYAWTVIISTKFCLWNAWENKKKRSKMQRKTQMPYKSYPNK